MTDSFLLRSMSLPHVEGDYGRPAFQFQSGGYLSLWPMFMLRRSSSSVHGNAGPGPGPTLPGRRHRRAFFLFLPLPTKFSIAAQLGRCRQAFPTPHQCYVHHHGRQTQERINAARSFKLRRALRSPSKVDELNQAGSKAWQLR